MFDKKLTFPCYALAVHGDWLAAKRLLVTGYPTQKEMPRLRLSANEAHQILLRD